MIYSNLSELIGGTPLVRLTNVENEINNAHLFAKVEFFNPAGSVKDRVARSILDTAEAQGRLRPGGTVIEATSGNTGIGLAALCTARGYKMIVVMPDTMSLERQKLMTAYGATLILTDGAEGMNGAIEKAEELHAVTAGSIIAGQFVNTANPQAHYETTGPEIWQDTEGNVDVFVAGVGTGGTITGVGKYLKEQNPAVEIVAVEPSGSPVLSGGEKGAHGLQGIGAGFIPKVLDQSVIDRIITVNEEEAYSSARYLAEREGLLCGISSGAALYAALTLAISPEYQGKNIVVLLPDGGERYLSTTLYL